MTRVTSSVAWLTTRGTRARLRLLRVVLPSPGGAVMLLASVALAVKAKVLPTPQRLATLLVLAGSQTTSALSPIAVFMAPPHGFAAPHSRPTDSFLPMAMTGIAGGALLSSYTTLNPFQGMSAHVTDFAFDVGDGLAPNPGELDVKWVLKTKRGSRTPGSLTSKLLVDCGCTAHMVGSVEQLS